MAESLISLERRLLNCYKQPQLLPAVNFPIMANSNHSLVVRQFSSEELLSSPHLHNWESRRPPPTVSLDLWWSWRPHYPCEEETGTFPPPPFLKITPSSSEKSIFLGKGDALNFQGLQLWGWKNRVNPIKLNGNSQCSKERGNQN